MTNPTEAPMANAIDDVKEWVLVPKVPTEAMREAAFFAAVKVNPGRSYDHAGAVALDGQTIYRAMIAAAPPSPAPSQHTGWSDEAVEALVLPNGSRLNESVVPRRVLEAFEDKYRKSFDLSVCDDDWGNTHRYKHSHIQCCWEGWRDGYLALTSASSIAPETGFEVPEYDPDAPPDHSADNAADFIFRELSSALEVDGKWSVSDGTETWDGDVRGTLYAILKAADIWDEEENVLVPRVSNSTIKDWLNLVENVLSGPEPDEALDLLHRAISARIRSSISSSVAKESGEP